MTKIKPYSYVSIGLIGISVAVAFMSGLGTSFSALQDLLISEPGHAVLSDILSGQVWRLITPIFIHFGLMHLVFNALWVWDLGIVIENKKGLWFYTGFVLVAAIISNLAQYLLSGSPLFGGLSGVVYGLFAYVWIRGRFDTSFDAGVRKATVNMMLAWFVLCWTGLLGPIANWAHTAGLLAGAAWAYLECRLLGLNTLVDTAGASGKQSLEYLSAADILKLEAQRAWVKEQYLPEARHKFDTVAGKLGIISAILNQKPLVSRPVDEQQSLEVVFADALVQETGLGWAIVDDDRQRTPVLVSADAPLIVFPLMPASKLSAGAGITVMDDLFATTVVSIRQRLQARA
ncbi:rhomboid family intramembrane serine protease [Undibacterium sp. TJN19]|uniref:rhomboid family intramembrane serine protease n=1 Tax=Undibacterium sp. TJN19 TaxID=3413055 RepID=UPI003BF42244